MRFLLHFVLLLLSALCQCISCKNNNRKATMPLNLLALNIPPYFAVLAVFLIQCLRNENFLPSICYIFFFWWLTNPMNDNILPNASALQILLWLVLLYTNTYIDKSYASFRWSNFIRSKNVRLHCKRQHDKRKYHENHFWQAFYPFFVLLGSL